MIYKPLAHILIYLLFDIFLVYDNICLGPFSLYDPCDL
jgi:hypothetical protein